jgi:ribosomal-protein-alanine N-acetyltransferase
MILAPATPALAPALARTHAAAFETGWSAADIAECLAGPGGFGLVAAEAEMLTGAADPPCGFVLARALAGEAEILTLAVAPDHRRQGLGRALLEAAIGLAATLGAEAMFLEVAADNDPAIALYAAAGFAPAGRRRAYYQRPGGPAVDALVLRRDLNTAPR